MTDLSKYVKPLRWGPDSPGDVGFWGNGLFSYQIRPGGSGYFKWRKALTGTWVIPDEPGVDAAKASASADYARRILEAVDLDAAIEAGVKAGLKAAAEVCDVVTMDGVGDIVRGKGDEIRALDPTAIAEAVKRAKGEGQADGNA